VLRLARDRTGVLLGLPAGHIRASSAADWGMTEVLSAGSASDLHQALGRHVPRTDDLEIGLPVVVVAMTAAQAADLFSNPPEAVADLMRSARWRPDRYGDISAHWRPFGSADTIEQVLNAAVDTVNQEGGPLRSRLIRLQDYPFDPLARDSLAMWPIYRDIARDGCLVVVDELSLFHREVRDALAASPIPDGEQVALVTVAALDPIIGTPYALVRDQLRGYLTTAARRFTIGLDPLCELGIPERHHLDRWLHASLPRATDLLKHAKRDDARIREFADELGIKANPTISRLIAGEHPG
jgi:hypothetical protein